VNEDFIHFIWKNSLFDQSALKTVDGEELSIRKLGFHNMHAGPDFLDARIRIGKRTWAGHVEIHLKSSNWYEHNHQEDEAYENVILHVVLEDDKPVSYLDGALIPTLVIEEKIDWSYFDNYQQLLKSKAWIPCESTISWIKPIDWSSWITRLAVSRLERKTGKILLRLHRNKGDWAETLYQLLAESFGLKVNGEAFLLLAESLPLNIIRRHGDDLFQLEAMLLGQAGFLQKPSEDAYVNRLHNEYSFLASKFGLIPLNAARVWKRFRMMPRNFPEIRISQFAALLFQAPNLIDELTSFESKAELYARFKVSASEFWNRHYTLERESKESIKRLGESTVTGICINTIAPFLFCLGRFKGDVEIEERAIGLLEDLDAEVNNITKRWKGVGFTVQNALESQGSLELKNEYCSNKKCLNCVLGTKMLKLQHEHD
jgi:hypothetical protein